MKGTYYKDPNTEVNLVEAEDCEEGDTTEIGLAEVMATRPYICRALIKPLGTQKTPQLAKDAKQKVNGQERSFSFDITKANQIFDLLLADKVIKLPNAHKIPHAEEIKKIQYCKWHHSWSHDTVNCIRFRNALQALIEKGTLKFPEKGNEVRGVDSNPFPSAGVNIIMANISKLAQLKTKIDLDLSTKKNNKHLERPKNEKDEESHKGKQ